MTAALLFDLDGTLVDSIQLILDSARYAFVGFDGHAPSDDEWRAGIGRPLQSVLREYAPDEKEATRLLARYREYQLEHHDRLLHAYDGVVGMLRQFAEDGHPLAIVTSKADWLARRALELIGVDALFPTLIGCDSCINFKPHPEPVERALGLLGVRASDAMFIGDSPHDVESGNAAGVFTVGVTWGASSPAEMNRSGADAVIHRVVDLPGIVAQFTRYHNRVQTF